MEGIMSNVWYVAAIVVAAFLIGFTIGCFGVEPKHDGWILVGMSEDGEREQIVWKLGMELDDIKKRRRITFLVADNTSKNSQSV